MQRAHLLATHERTSRRWWMLVAAGAVAVVTVGAWWLAANRGAAAPTTEALSAMQVTLDLRPYSVTRSPTAPDVPPPLELPRAVVGLTVLLPVGSEPGHYDVQVLDGANRSVAATQGEAAIVDFVTTMKAVIDLRDIGRTNGTLAVRYQDDQWRLFRVELR